MKRCATCDTVYSGEMCPRCVAEFARKETLPNPEVEEIALKRGATFHGLEIVGILGKGGMGVVYRARQPALDRPVALKLLPRKLALDPDFQGRFIREAKALAALSHPNIVTIHDFGAEAGVFFLVMEFVDGTTLRDVMRSGELSPGAALKIVPQLCDALEYAHGEGVIHRDIKPENIMLDRKGRVKIADFGLAKLVGSDTAAPAITQTNVVMGTPHYMAPEQFENPKSVDHRADIYSMGVVLYEMLTGELPLGKFDAPSKKVQVDVRLDEVVLRTLEKAPERRYQRASHVKDDITRATTVLPSLESQVPTVVTPLPVPPRRNAAGPIVLIAVVVFLVFVMLVGVSVFVMQARRSAERARAEAAERERAARDLFARKIPEPVRLERIYFRPDERPAGYAWAKTDEWLPRNPLPAKSPEELETLVKFLDLVGLQNVSRTDLKEGYIAAWYRVGMIAMDSPVAARLERDFLANRKLTHRWAWRRGDVVVLAYAGRRDYRMVFADLVARIQRKVGSAIESPDLPLENVTLDRDHLSLADGWTWSDSFGSLKLPLLSDAKEDKERLLSGLQTMVRVEPAEVSRVHGAAFRKKGGEPAMYVVGIEFTARERAQSFAKEAAAAKGWQGARKTEVLLAGRTVAVAFLHSADLGAYERILRQVREWMGFEKCSFGTLLPVPEDLPPGFAIDRTEEDVKEILRDLGLDLEPSEVARVRRLRFRPEGSAVLVEMATITHRGKVEQALATQGAAWSDGMWVCGVAGPEALQSVVRQGFTGEP